MGRDARETPAAGVESMTEANLQALIENTEDIIASYDRELRLLVFNRACSDTYRQLFGIELRVGLVTLDFFPESTHAFWHANDRRVLAGEVFSAEIDIPLLSGELHTFEISYNPIRSEDQVVGFSTFTRDITERKAAERKLALAEAQARDERNRLDVTLRSIGEGVITTDIEGRVTLLNNVAERLTGYSQQEAIGRPLQDIYRVVSPVTVKLYENPVERSLRTDCAVDNGINTKLVSRHGVERLVAESAAAIRDEHGDTLGMVLVLRDVTEHTKFLEAMERTSRLESVGILAGGIAHDFNNLLGSLYGYIDLAIPQCKDEECALLLEEAMSSMDRARGLTSQLLTFSKGGMPNKRLGLLSPIVRECALFATSGAPVSCRFDLAENLWTCEFDRIQIGQVIDNLAINATQAMPTGGKIDISTANVTLAEGEVAGLHAGNYVRVSVCDQGVGIPASILPRIFDPFFTTKSAGSGLGLATAFSIIHRHGGTIMASSEQDHGSSFTFFLPASDGTAESVATVSRGSLSGSGTVLVLDDDPAMVNILAAMLERVGFNVLKARSGDEALRQFTEELAAGRPPRAAILDLTGAGTGSGKAVGLAIRSIDPHVKLFVTSGYAVDPVMTDPTSFGFSGSISKPFRTDDVLAVIERHGLMNG